MSQTVTENSAPSPKLVGCTKCTPYPACAHIALCCKPSLAVSEAWPGRVAGLGGSISARTRAPLRVPCAVSQCFPRPCCVCILIQPSGQAAFLSRYAHSCRNTVPQQLGPRTRAACTCARAGRIAPFLDRVVASPHRIVATAVAVSQALLCASLAMLWPPECA